MADAVLARLRAILTADTRQLDSTLLKTERRAAAFSRNLSRTFARAFAGIGAGFAVREIVRATIQQENALRKLDQAIQATGRAGRISTAQIAEFASAIQRTTTFADEAVIDLAAFTLQFRNIGEEVLPRALKAILDFSAFTGRDAVQAAKLFGIALNDPAAGMGRLSQAGVSLSTSVKETIKTLTAQGRLVEAQTIFLDELEKSFKGAAEAARGTFGGALTSLKNAFGDLLEQDALLGVTDEIERLTAALQTDTAREFADLMGKGLVTAFRALHEAAGGAVSAVNELRELLGDEGLRVLLFALAGGFAGRKFGPVGALVGAGAGAFFGLSRNELVGVVEETEAAITRLAQASKAQLPEAFAAAKVQLKEAQQFLNAYEAEIEAVAKRSEQGLPPPFSQERIAELDRVVNQLNKLLIDTEPAAVAAASGVTTLGDSAKQTAKEVDALRKAQAGVGETLTEMAEKVADAQAELAELRGEAGAVAAREVRRLTLEFQKQAIAAKFDGEALQALVRQAEGLAQAQADLATQIADEKKLQQAVVEPFANAADEISGIYRGLFGEIAGLAEGILGSILPPQLRGITSSILGTLFGGGFGRSAERNAQKQTSTLGSMLGELRTIGGTLGNILTGQQLTGLQQQKLLTFFGGGKFAGQVAQILQGPAGQVIPGAAGAVAGYFLANPQKLAEKIATAVGAVSGAVGGAFLGMGLSGGIIGAQLGNLLGGPAARVVGGRGGLTQIATLLDAIGVGTAGLLQFSSGNIKRGLLELLAPAFGPLINNAINEASFRAQLRTVAAGIASEFEDEFLDGISVEGPFGVVAIVEKNATRIKEGFARSIIEATVAIDREVARFLTESEISDVAIALQTTTALSKKVNSAKKLLLVVAADRLGTVLEAVAGEVGRDFAAAAFAEVKATKGLKKSPEGVKRLVELVQGFLGERLEVQALIEQARVLAGVDQAATDAAEALERIEELFKAISERGQAVGIALNNAAELQAKAIEKLGVDFLAEVSNAILAITNPLELALKQQAETAEERLRNARDLGVETVLLERLAALEREEILKRFAARAQSLLEELLTGKAGGLSPTTILANARGLFDALRESLLAGDTSVADELAEAARRLLEAQREVTASGAATQEVFRLIIETLKQVPGVDISGLPGFQGGGSFRIPGGAGEVVPIFRAHGGEVVSINRGAEAASSEMNELLQENREQRAYLKTMVRRMEQLIEVTERRASQWQGTAIEPRAPAVAASGSGRGGRRSR